jgi:hypothetical protein
MRLAILLVVLLGVFWMARGIPVPYRDDEESWEIDLDNLVIQTYRPITTTHKIVSCGGG